MGPSWKEAGDQQWQTVGVGGDPGRIRGRKPGFLFQTCFSPSAPSQKMAPQHTRWLPPARNSQSLLAHPFSLSPSTPLQFCPCSHSEKGTISRPGQCPAEGVYPSSRAVGLSQQLPASLGRKWRVGFSHREAPPIGENDEGSREQEVGVLQDSGGDGLVAKSCLILAVPRTVACQVPQNTGVGCHFFSRGSSGSRNRTRVSYIAGRFFNNWATREIQ